MTMILRIKFSKDLFDDVHSVFCYGDLESLTLLNQALQKSCYVSSVSFFEDKKKEEPPKTDDLPF